MTSPYFELKSPVVIRDAEKLLSLNVERDFYQPGNLLRLESDLLNLAYSPHTTAGIFRGQIADWSLLPDCYRKVDLSAPRPTRGSLILSNVRALHDFHRFCDRAEKQIPDFPKLLVDRLSIAQQFGVSTPLLDWSRNIFTAIFFAVRHAFSTVGFEDKLKVYIYHIVDERLLHRGIPAEEAQLREFNSSAFIEPFHIDRRIERQRGVFTYHPHPLLSPEKVPVDVYVIESNLMLKLKDLMQGLGFTDDYYFPDYAGIADAVVNKRSWWS